MTELHDGQFPKLVHDIFDPIIEDFGFKFYSETNTLLFAGKDEIELSFRLEPIYQAYLFSLAITLSGKLGEEATHGPSFRTLGVKVFPKYFNPEYQRSLTSISTEEELKEMMEIQKGELLQYCQDILRGDVSLWSKVTGDLIKQTENAKNKFPKNG